MVVKKTHCSKTHLESLVTAQKMARAEVEIVSGHGL